MRINHNIAALNTYRQLTSNTSNTSKSLEKLSSGLRINRAGDDAAGLAISEKMRSQIRGLDTASKNASDGISLIQTAEGALNETHSILQRMKELAVQASNDTNTESDRAEIQKEIDQLTTEVTRIAKDTEFNTKKLLDGTMASKATVAGTAAANVESVTVAAGTPPVAGTYTVTVAKTDGEGGQDAVAATGSITANPSAGVTADFDASGVPSSVAAGTYTFAWNNSTNSWTLDTGSGPAAFDAANFSQYGLTVGTGSATGNDTFTLKIDSAAQDAVPGEEGEISWTITDSKGAEVKNSAFEINLKDSAADGDTFTIGVANDQATIFHIGANSGQNTSLVINNMDAKSLGLADLDLTTQANADKSITTIDNAINKVSSQRAALGAMQNRLEHTINNLGTASENLTAAESRIRDVDMAKEMMEFTKNNILSQASQAMLAQANMQPQGVLQLLQ